MFRIVMISVCVVMGLVACGDDVTQQQTEHNKPVATVSKHEVSTQDVKKREEAEVAPQKQTVEASQELAQSLAEKKDNKPVEAEVTATVGKGAGNQVQAGVLSKVDAVKHPQVAEVAEVADKSAHNAKAEVVKVAPQEALVASGDAKRGRSLAKRCLSCHDFGMKDKFGPHLQGVFNRAAGQSGFKKHSPALKAANWQWDEEHLLAWVCDSKAAIKQFTGDASATTRMPAQKMCADKGRDIVAFLKTL